jgi:MarR family transcriptional regulator, transcriptional regulator for hemolysin
MARRTMTTSTHRKDSARWNPRASVTFWINLASRSLVRLQDSRLRPLGFGMNQMPVLHALKDGVPTSQKDLARIARVEQPTMAEMLARMERGGVIERGPNPADGRGSLASLTRKSRLSWPKARTALIGAGEEALEGFSDVEKTVLLGFLQRVVRNIEGEPPDSGV